MLYSETDRTQAIAEQKRRRLWTVVPAAVLGLLAVAVFLWFRLHRNADGWVWSGLLTIAGGSYFLFFYGVYLRPVSLYKRHLDFMLDGRKRETVGILQSVDQTPRDKDGLDCIAFTINVGSSGSAEDERSFYLDALKPWPDIPLGARVRVLSNDRMTAELEPAVGES